MVGDGSSFEALDVSIEAGGKRKLFEFTGSPEPFLSFGWFMCGTGLLEWLCRGGGVELDAERGDGDRGDGD